MFFKKKPIPKSLRICLVGQRIRVLSRKSDHGFVWPIARGLALQGHHVTVISNRSPMGKTDILRDGVHAFYLQENLRSSNPVDFKKIAFNKFQELHKKEPFHVLHSLDESGLEIAKHKKKLNFQVAFDIEATHLSRLFGILGMRQDTVRSQIVTWLALGYRFLETYFKYDRKLLNYSDGIFVTNPQQRTILERYYLYPDYNIYSVPYGIDVGDLSPKEQSQELRKKLNLSLSTQVVITTSEMNDKHEMKNILEAFEKVAIKKANAHLIILGAGPAFKDIEYEMLNLALGHRVTMTGSLKADEILDFILLGDIFVDLSSQSTGFEPTLIEAMAQKKIIIGSEVSPMVNVVEDGVDGFLLRPADTESLSHLILELLNGGLPVQEIGNKAREKVIQLFDTSKMVSGVLQAYRSIMEKKGNFKNPNQK